MPALDKDQWRLGHRRPWWQWNVLTLFAILFVLVWVREIWNLDFFVTLLVCGLLLIAWFAVPLVLLLDVSAKVDNAQASNERGAIHRNSAVVRIVGLLLLAVVLLQALLGLIDVVAR